LGDGMDSQGETSQSTAAQLKNELENLLRQKMGEVFNLYNLDLEGLLTPFKWKSLVLIIGNYSSGKSTFINEFLGRTVQRTGQAPTDDSFTILSAPESDGPEHEIPGSTLVNDDLLPFAALRRFGHNLLAHLHLREINSPLLRELAIIDTPGMLDSVTEKDRGYDYLGVVGELAGLADLIILMFDPHKAGTIKETYQAIRSTLPLAAGQDRILFVLNRIDECDNIKDLVRSYGTLCWNLSQMTGRKDMPRIFLTFAPQEAGEAAQSLQDLDLWMNDRDQIKKAIGSAPRLRLDHILEDVDRCIRELRLQTEALGNYQSGFFSRLRSVIRNGAFVALPAFFLGDLLLRLLIGLPDPIFLEALLAGNLEASHWAWPIGFAMLAFTCSYLYVQHLLYPRYLRQTLADLDRLVTLNSVYEHDLWLRARERVHDLISREGRKHLWIRHRKHYRQTDSFLHKELRRIYQRLQSAD
jgi:EH domain-containing protein 1